MNALRWIDIERRFRNIAGVGRTTDSQHPQLHIRLLANFSTQFLAKSLTVFLSDVEAGQHVKVSEGSFNNWEQELVLLGTGQIKYAYDAIVVSLSSYSLLSDERARQPAIFIANIKRLIENTGQLSKSNLFITMPEPIDEELYQTSSLYDWRQQLRSEMRGQLAEIATLIDLDPLVMQIGFNDWRPGKYYISAKLACHPNAHVGLGEYLGRFVKSTIRQPVRMVIVDLDNTLWGGVVGDLTWRGVNLDANEGGFPYLRIQHFLKDLRNRGVLLAICSKNEEGSAKEVFQRRREMLLEWGDFAATRLNWERKSANIASILAELNLTEAGVCFLDDSAFERDEVRSALPGLTVLDMPGDVEAWVYFLLSTGLFVGTALRNEDKLRQQSYEVERVRKAEMGKATSYEDYLRSLEMHLTVLPIDVTTLPRVVELLKKTNQFNLTTRRHGAGDVSALMGQNRSIGYCYSLADKFGQYGIISMVVVVERDAAHEIDSWVLSCRAMGRHVEHAICQHVIDEARARSVEVIRGVYLPTEKNKPVADLYDRLGFSVESLCSDRVCYLANTDLHIEGADIVTVGRPV